jgi:protoporphyrinogen oxidase
VAQPDREHVRRVQRIHAYLDDQPGLALAGSYLAGVSVPDTFASGVAAARQLLQAEGKANWEI